MEYKEDNKRIREIDIAKGVVIFLVVIGHLVPFDGSIFKWIFSFHMPFFFFVHGYCTLENKQFSLLHTAQRLLIPSLIVRCIFCLRDGFVIESYTDAAYYLFCSPSSEWFFSTMFLSLLIMQIYIRIDRRITNMLEKMFFAGLCIALSFYGVERFVMFGYHDALSIPFKIDSAFLGFDFILIGWWFRNRSKLVIPEKLSKPGLLCGVLIGVVLTAFSIKNDYVNMAGGWRGVSDTYYLFTAIYWTIFILTVCKIYINWKAPALAGSDSAPPARDGWLTYFGKRTNFIYPAHSIINAELNKIFLLWGYEFVPTISLPWYMGIVYFVIDLIVMTICLKIIDQIKKFAGKAWQALVILLTIGLIGGLFFSVWYNTTEKQRTIFKNFGDFAGAGTETSPYLISDAEDLARLRDMVNLGGATFDECFFYQTDDIDLAEYSGWTPIGEFGGGNYFFGVYDGGGHKIWNLNIPYEQGSTPAKNYGLFGQLGGTVINLGIESGTIEGDCCGSIASHAIGDAARIINCYNKATIIAHGRAGGIADNFFGGQILNCWNEGTLDAPTTSEIASYGGGVD